jgi:hypothetical protein
LTAPEVAVFARNCTARRSRATHPSIGTAIICSGPGLAADPAGLSRRMASLLDLDAERVRLWLFARCAQESLGDPTMREPAKRLAP